MSSEIIKKLTALEAKRSRLVKELLSANEMIRGKFSINHSKCGGANCWCAEAEKGHPTRRVYWSEKMKTYSRIIAKDQVEWVKVATENYRRFRKIRQEIREINEEQRLLLNDLEEHIVCKTRKRRKFK